MIEDEWRAPCMRQTVGGRPHFETAAFLHRLSVDLARAVHCLTSSIPGNGMTISPIEIA
jgi:hypothetical protein